MSATKARGIAARGIAARATKARTLGSSGASSGASPPANWYNASWAHRYEITLSGATGTQSNFPVLITEANLPAHFFSNVKSDGTDIVVTAGDGQTKLDRDLVSINTGSETMELYARVPSLTSASTIYLYYGNAGASETNATATYNSNIILFFPDGYSGNRTATASTDTVTGVLSTTGKIGGAGDFDGIDDHNENALTGFSAADWTVLAWINPDSFAAAFRFIGRSGSIGSLGFDDASTFARETGMLFSLSSSFSALAWEMVAATNNDAGNAGVVYKGKTSVYSGAKLGSTLAPFDIGRGSNGSYLPGKLDHLMLIDAVQSADWVATMYDQTNNPAGFYSVATREDYS